MADATGQGDFRELLVRGVHGYVATYAAGTSAVLTLLAQDRVNVGRLHLEGRRSGTRIGELVDAATARGEPATPARAPAKTAAAPSRNRTARGTASQRTATAATRTPNTPTTSES